MTEVSEPVESVMCIGGTGRADACNGPVEYRMPLSGTGRSFPRCDQHWNERLDLEQQLCERYPETPPADWSPLDAGEAWDVDDY